jgi:uncharacterized protein DUF3179
MRTRLLVIVLAVATLASIVWVVTPMALVRPFGPQTPGGLAVAFAMRARGGALTLVLLLLGSLAALLLWPRLASWKGRLPAGLAIVLLAACAFIGRSNYFEWMFHPLPAPRFVEVALARNVADDDLVLGVQVASEAHAYPVREMAYHHVVNDVIASVPIAATY